MAIISVGFGLCCLGLGYWLGSSTKTEVTSSDVDSVQESSSSSTGSNPSQSSSGRKRNSDTRFISDRHTLEYTRELISDYFKETGKPIPELDFLSQNDPLIEELEISEDELFSIKEDWQSSLDEVRRLEAERVEVKSESDSEITLHLKESESERIAVREYFAEKLRKTLGDARADTLLLLKRGDSLFSRRAKGADYQVTVEESSPGQFVYRIQETSEGFARTMVGNAIPKAIRHLTDKAGLAHRFDQIDDEEE